MSGDFDVAWHTLFREQARSHSRFAFAVKIQLIRIFS
jgi:hypothetical protein